MIALVTLARLANERRHAELTLIAMRSHHLEIDCMFDEIKKLAGELKTEAQGFVATVESGKGVIGEIVTDVQDALTMFRGAHDGVKTILSQGQAVAGAIEGAALTEAAGEHAAETPDPVGALATGTVTAG